MPKHQEGRSPFKFFGLTLAYSWGLWLPALFFNFDDYGLNAYFPLALIGGFAPAAAALTLVVRRHGWREGWQFIRQPFDFRTRPVHYALALIVPMMIMAASHYLARQLNLPVADTLFPESMGNPWLAVIPYFFMILLVGGGQEEWGWRGYAQQPLQERFGITKASLMIGLVWGVWHLPLWAFPEGQGQYSALGFIINTAAVSVIYGLLYNASGQKLIVAFLFHAMWNSAPPLFPFLHEIEGEPQTAYWVYTGVTVATGIISAYIIRRRFEATPAPATLTQPAG